MRTALVKEGVARKFEDSAELETNNQKIESNPSAQKVGDYSQFVSLSKEPDMTVNKDVKLYLIM